jgi:hypothetical protein
MKDWIPAFLVLLMFTPDHAQCNPVSRGKPLCSGDDCYFVEVPLGTAPSRQEPLQSIPNVPLSSRPNAPTKKASPAREQVRSSNLPNYYSTVDRSHYAASERAVFVPAATSPKLPGINSGDVLDALVEQAIKASPSVPSPIRATVLSGSLKGSFLIGSAKLDGELKRVLLTFSKIRTPANQTYKINATGLSVDGRVGLEGAYHSDTGNFFMAELAASTAAAIADSTISRQQTTLGGWVQEPSLLNHAKQGTVAALSKSAERVAETVRSAPEWTEIKGFQQIRVIVEKDPTEDSN